MFNSLSNQYLLQAPDYRLFTLKADCISGCASGISPVLGLGHRVWLTSSNLNKKSSRCQLNPDQNSPTTKLSAMVAVPFRRSDGILNNNSFPVLDELPPEWANLEKLYPKSAQMLKQYYYYPDFPDNFIFPLIEIFFDEKLVYSWALGIEEKFFSQTSASPQIIRIEFTSELGFLLYNNQILLDRISQVKLAQIYSAFKSWLLEFYPEKLS